jgi:hypothetical protein
MGYGKWPLNFFDRSPAGYAFAGISLIIPITDWQDVRHKTRQLDAGARELELERKTLDRKREGDLARMDAEIEKYIRLQEASRNAAEKWEALCAEYERLADAGSLPQSEYLDALEQLSAARLDCEIYSILKLKRQLGRRQYIVP